MRILMMGTGTFAEPTFQALLDGQHEVVGLVTNPDRPSGKDREMVRHIKQQAVENNIPVLQPVLVNTQPSLDAIRLLRPELFVVAAYGQILSKETLSVPVYGGINVHASLLPKYRGAAPVAWAIYHGETETGVTIIRMSPQMDAGDMLAQHTVPIAPEETAGELEGRLALVGAKLTLKVIGQIEAGTLQGIRQDLSQVTKAPKLKKEQGLIDWARSAEQVCNQIRAMQPWPSAYTYLTQENKSPQRIILLRTSVFDTRSPVVCSELANPPVDLDPGAVVGVTHKTSQKEYDHAVIVNTGNGQLRIHQLQPAGKRSMTIDEFLRGHPLKVGDRFSHAISSKEKTNLC